MLEYLLLVAWPVVGMLLAVAVRRAFRRWKRRGLARVVTANLAVLFVVVFFAVYAAEIYLRVRYGLYGQWYHEREGRTVPFYTGTVYPVQPDNLLGWSMTPGAQGTFYGPDCTYRFTINAKGFRDRREFSATKERPRILVLGDSFSFGHGVPDGKEWPKLLEEKLNGWEVINSSVSSYSEVQMLLYLENRGVRYAPDVVIVAHFGGALSRNIGGSVYTYAGTTWQRPHATLEAGALTIHKTGVTRRLDPGGFLDESFLYNRLRVPFVRARFKKQMKEARPQRSKEEQRARSALEHELFNALLLRIRSAARAAGAKQVVVVYLPSITEVNYRGRALDQEKGGDEGDKRIRAFCQKNRIPYLDLTPRYLEWYRNNPDALLYFMKDAHPTELGQRLIAEEVERTLRVQGIAAARQE